VTDFEYRPEEGVAIMWLMTISGYDEEMDGEWDEPLGSLSDVEQLIENLADAYRDDTGVALVRVHGAHGWREFEWSNGALHRYEWSHEPLDMRCDLCRSPITTCTWSPTTCRPARV
jgi:hypothetical protein